VFTGISVIVSLLFLKETAGKRLEEITDDEWRRGLDTNLSSQFYGCRAVIPHLVKQNRGKISKLATGYGMRGSGTWALLYPSEFAYANGAEVLRDGKVVINSKEAIDALAWYLDLALKHKVTPPSAATDGFVEIVETFGRGVTSMYQHNSGSAGQQKKNVGAAKRPKTLHQRSSLTKKWPKWSTATRMIAAVFSQSVLSTGVCGLR